MEDLKMSTYVGLSITTPEEVRKGLEQTQQEDCKKYRLETFDKFIKDWNVAYFFNLTFLTILQLLWMQIIIAFSYCSHITTLSRRSFVKKTTFVNMLIIGLEDITMTKLMQSLFLVIFLHTFRII